jgi:ABC-type transport system involved in cytochrome c biogenesis permease subunit
MATDVKAQLAGANHSSHSAQPMTAEDVLLAVPRAVASLKLTVMLFGLSMILVFTGTLAQVDNDIWDVMRTYFRCFITYIPLNSLIPAPWSPAWHDAIPERLGFWFPGGYTIGILMAANLLAAHGLRFKVQASGLRLLLGLVVILVGIGSLIVVIFSGHASGALQGIPAFGLSPVWMISKIALVLACIAGVGFCAYEVFQMVSSGAERAAGKSTLVAMAGLFCIGFPIWLIASGYSPNDAALRILWQLFTSTIASVILLIGCIMVFKKRGGIVLIHAGIGLLMAYEAYVSLNVVEERIVLTEGESSAYAFDIRETELAFVLPKGKEQTEVAIPTTLLEEGEKFSHPDLPVDLEVVKFYRNSTPDDIDKAKIKANKGFGKFFSAQEEEAATGVGDGGVDSAAMYVTFYAKPKKDAKKSEDKPKKLGTYLLTQFHSSGNLVRVLNPEALASLRKAGLKDTYDELKVGEKTYEVSLRHKRTYKPYEFTLLDVRKDDYVGTNTPKNYASYLRLVDKSNDVDKVVSTRMNDPLRYGGETFYQSGYDGTRMDVEGTTLQVVTNEGWMVPYLCCMMVWVGLLAHFTWVSLLPFLNRGRRRTTSPVQSSDGIVHAPAKPVVSDAEVIEPTPLWLLILGILVPAFFAFIAIGYLGKAAVMPIVSTTDEEFHIDKFGQQPVASGGRVMPYDGLARYNLKSLNYGREEFEGKVGGKKPAIVWLLDVISHSDDALDHKVFYIPNADVRTVLALAARQGYKYSLSEFRDKIETIRDEAKRARDVDGKVRTAFDRKIIDLDVMVSLYFQIRESHRIPDFDGVDSPLDQIGMLVKYASLVRDLGQSEVPNPIKFGPGETDWKTLTASAGQNWIKSYAKEKGVSNTDELVERLVLEVCKERVLIQIAKIASDVNPEATDEAHRRRAEEVFARAPDEQKIRMLAAERAELNPEIVTDILSAVQTLLGGDTLNSPQDKTTAAFVGILQAYEKDDAKAFNKHLAEYSKLLKLDSKTKSRVAKEYYFNRFSPFYYTLVMYVLAGVLSLLAAMAAVFSFFGAPEIHKPIGRAALVVIVITFLVHTLALWARIDISGRPPVTNLYSSALFIGWAGVAFGIGIELIYRIGVGNLVASLIGGITLVIASFLGMAGDNIGVLQAVLDTQFWLATHVICITLGYSATFVAGGIGIIYLFGGTFAGLLRGVLPQDEEVQRTTLQVADFTDKALSTVLYGTVCFALLLSFVGTVLGGLWADDSWGRFWGWDPKENGALMIVIWNALILHARWDKLISGRGMANLVVLGNIVTAWSWFGVNLLGVGLHSYGFTENGLFWLGMFVLSQLAIVAFGILPLPMWGKKSVLGGRS